MTDKEILEIEYKYNLDKLIKSRNLAAYAFQMAENALAHQLEYEKAFQITQEKLCVFNQIEDCERRVNQCP